MVTTLARSARRLFGISLLALLVPSLASAQANPVRPYKARLSTTTTSIKQVSDTEILLTYVGTGNGTHVGAYQESGSYLLDLTTFTFVGEATAAAADGSTFSFTIAGGFTGPTTLAGVASVTGGTRRFAGATGVFAFTGEQTSPIHISARIAGWIRF
jgi:hypothetical protein